MDQIQWGCARGIGSLGTLTSSLFANFSHTVPERLFPPNAIFGEAVRPLDRLQDCHLFCIAATPLRVKNSLAKFFSRDSLVSEGGMRPAFARRAAMAWKAPKIVEVPVGMEINMYACAARK
jgi:coenzyme PQQ precursor peptide PqqA